MDSKYEQVLVGLIVLLLGLVFLFQDKLILNFGSLSLVVLGLAFILLYFTKKKSWSLCIGALHIFVGMVGFVSDNAYGFLSKGITSDQLLISIFCILVGMVLVILYLDKNKTGLLIPGSLIVGFGLNGLLKLCMPSTSTFSFYLSMAVAFLFIYLQGKYTLGKWPFYAFVIMIILAISRFVFFTILA